MKATDELLESAGESVEYIKLYVKQQKQALRLEIAERLSKSISSMVTVAVLGFLATMVIMFLTISVGFWLGSMWGSYALAFLVITIFYALVATAIWFFKRQLITNPVLSSIIKSIMN